MARILYIHGLFARPGGNKATALRCHGHEVRDPRIDYRRPLACAVRQLQAEYDTWRPDVIVGTSLGGGVAMSLRSGDTPMVLISPMWDLSRVSVPFETVAQKAGFPLALVAAAVGAAGTSLAWPLSSFWSIDVPTRVKPQTIILQAADDAIIPCRHSRSLLAASPRLSVDSPVRGVIDRLRQKGYRVQDEGRGDDPRLVIIGKGHHCKVASERCPANPGKSPLDCLVLASSELAALVN
jgi:hypothetical protein